MTAPRQPRSSAPALKKRFGQHHLRSANACRRSIDFLDLEGREVLEIGGGGGVLTRLLAERARRVWAWEVDPEWAFVLRRRLLEASSGGERGIGVVVGDALDIDWPRLPRELRIAGNLPYNVGTRIILDFLQSSAAERAAFLVQAEVADRLVARPGDPAYGSLSVAAAALARVERLGRVARGDFRPPPKVDGAFVGFVRSEPPVAEAEVGALLDLVKVAFSSRRKTLRNALRRAFSTAETESALDALGWSSKIRAEALGVSDFVALYRALASREGSPEQV